MEHYDQSKIGRCISWTGDHNVYAYGTDEVIKFSKFDFFLGYEKTKHKAISDIEICKKFFGTYLLETRVVSSAYERRVALVQKRVAGRFLSKRDLQNSTIVDQFAEIMTAYRRLLAERHAYIDLIGGRGALSGTMSNIFIDDADKLIFFDATIFELTDFHPVWRVFLWPLFTLAYILQRATIKRFEST
ncbi:MAG: hypothetical protein AAB573_00985 [Patescibacteria group bacterium]